MSAKEKLKFQVEEIYVYGLSPKVLDSLQLLYFDSSTAQETSPLTAENLKKVEPNNSSEVHFLKDKDYYKSDLHRLNLKREVRGIPPLTEAEFDALAGDLDESISGSDSSYSTDDDENDDDIHARKTDKLDTIFEESVRKIESLKIEDSDRVISHLATRSPYILFKSSLLNQDKCFGVYKAIFTIDQLERPLDALSSWQSQKVPKKSALLMIGGGHFAGAIINHKPKAVKGNAAKKDESLLEQAVDIIEHKSFHRYTTRRKQGGSQSASDNARGKANSAGSSLRRYNEAALQNEVRDLLSQWRSHLSECESIFIRANGAANRNIILGYEGGVLKNDDARIKNFPFTTKRATASEVKKAWINLTYLKITDKPKVDEKKLKQHAAAQREKEQSQLKVVQDVKEIPIEEKHTIELINYLRKSRGPLLITYLKKHQLPPDFRLQPVSSYEYTPTLLHYASAHGLKNMIPVLIKTARSNPITLNSAGKTAYDLAPNKLTKQTFQYLRFELGEDSIDWESAHVGKPLNKEEVEAQEKQKEEEEKIKLIREELEKAKLEDLDSPKKSNVNKLGGISAAHANLNSLSDDQRIRLMREQRARAAEARFKSQQTKS